MSAIAVIRRFGEFSLPPNGPITGGQLVVGAVVGGVDTAEVAGASATNVLGVCLLDCDTQADISPTDAFPAADRCTIGAHGEFQVTYAAAANVGDKLVAAANGQVTPSTTASAAEQVGYCTQTTAAGAVGNAYIG